MKTLCARSKKHPIFKSGAQTENANTGKQRTKHPTFNSGAQSERKQPDGPRENTERAVEETPEHGGTQTENASTGKQWTKTTDLQRTVCEHNNG